MSELYNNNYAAGQDSNFMDWNDTIQSDGAEFVVLEPGDYEFEVVEGQYQGHLKNVLR